MLKHWRLIIFKLLIFAQLSCSASPKPWKSQEILAVKLDELILKFLWQFKGPRIAKAVLAKKAGELALLDFETNYRAQWQPTPVLLPGKSPGQRSLVGCSPWGAEGRTWLSNFTFTFHFDVLEKEMATHSSILAWRIPGMGEPGGLPSMGLCRVGHDWSDLAAA